MKGLLEKGPPLKKQGGAQWFLSPHLSASLHPMTPPPFNIQAYCSKKVPAVFQKGGYSFSAIPHRKRIGRRNVFGELTGYSRFESVCGELSLFSASFSDEFGETLCSRCRVLREQTPDDSHYWLMEGLGLGHDGR